MDTPGKRLAYVRTQTGLNKSDFALLIGKQYKQVLAWEGDRQTMSIDTLSALKDRLGVSKDWISDGTGPTPVIAPVDPQTVRAPAQSTVDRSDALPPRLLTFLRATPVTEDERTTLIARAASDGQVDYDDVLRELRVPAHKRSREPEATKVELPDGVMRLPAGKRKRS